MYLNSFVCVKELNHHVCAAHSNKLFFFCLSHRLMYKSITSVTEVIQRKSACSYLCLPNSHFYFFFFFPSASLESSSCSGVFIASFFMKHLSYTHCLISVAPSARLLRLYMCTCITDFWIWVLNLKRQHMQKKKGFCMVLYHTPIGLCQSVSGM